MQEPNFLPAEAATSPDSAGQIARNRAQARRSNHSVHSTLHLRFFRRCFATNPECRSSAGQASPHAPGHPACCRTGPASAYSWYRCASCYLRRLPARFFAELPFGSSTGWWRPGIAARGSAALHYSCRSRCADPSAPAKVESPVPAAESCPWKQRRWAWR